MDKSLARASSWVNATSSPVPTSSARRSVYLTLPPIHRKEQFRLTSPLVSSHTLLTASVVQWFPPLSDGRGDIAGLELPCDPPAGAEIVRFTPAEDVWEHDFSVLGFPAGYDDGVWATGRLLRRQATNWIQVEDVKAQGFAIAPGFSGAPVWDMQLQGVVGMVVAASRPMETRTAFVIPWMCLLLPGRFSQFPKVRLAIPTKDCVLSCSVMLLISLGARRWSRKEWSWSVRWRESSLRARALDC